MVSLEDLSGWRKADSRECKYIQGAILPLAKEEKRWEFWCSIFAFAVGYGLAAGALRSVNVILESRSLSDYKQMAVGAVGALLFAVGALCIFWWVINTWRKRPGKKYYQSILRGEFKVNDVFVYQDITPFRSNSKTGLIQDKQGNQSDQKVGLLVRGQGERLFVYVGIDASGEIRGMALPCFDPEEKICKKALADYQKYSKKIQGRK